MANSFPRFAMAAPIPLRPDFEAPLLRKLARGSRDPDQIRRLLALAEIYDGGSRSDAARIGGVGLQIVRDWVLWFNAEGPDGLVNGKAPGAPSLLNDHLDLPCKSGEPSPMKDSGGGDEQEQTKTIYER